LTTTRRPLRHAAATILAVLTLVGATATGAGAAASRPTVPAVATAFPSVGGNWDRPGPFAVTVEAAGGATTVYRPTDLGQGGLRHPVILWGNGTFAWPAIYDGLLRHWASHGFIVAAANTSWAGSGQEMLAGATWLANENSRAGSVYFGRVDTSRIGATGHSQGGGGAIAAGADPRVDTTIPIQPGPQGTIARLQGPLLMLAGQSDTIVWPWLLVLPRYNEAGHVPAVYGELAGAGHFETLGDGGGFRAVTTAWFRFWLMDDQQARAEFFGPATTCGLCRDGAWSDVRRNARALAIPAA
jgi:hypothetical protein